MALRDIRPARGVERLAVEDQRVLREIEEQRQAESDSGGNLEKGGDQLLWYSSPPFFTNSTAFSFKPFST